VIDDFREEASVRLEQMKNLAAGTAEVAGKTARGTRQLLSSVARNIRLRRSQVTSLVCEGKARLRRGWRRIVRRSPPPALVPVFSSSDFMETLFQRSIDSKLHALLQLRTAVRLGCEPTAESRSETCLQQGWPAELVREAHNGGDLGFSESEGLLLRYADDITRTPIDVDLQVFRHLRRHFTHDQIVEITAAICYENFRTRFRNAMGVEASAPQERSSAAAAGAENN
jgi:alkylhydroperoxidase family enzyme